MGFRISALDGAQFSHLINLGDDELSAQGVQRMVVTDKPGFPCRVSLKDYEVGQTVLLLNYEHLDASTPYRSSHAIFVGEGAAPAVVDDNDIPESIRSRLISVRAFDADGMMRDADVWRGKHWRRYCWVCSRMKRWIFCTFTTPNVGAMRRA